MEGRANVSASTRTTAIAPTDRDLVSGSDTSVRALKDAEGCQVPVPRWADGVVTSRPKSLSELAPLCYTLLISRKLQMKTHTRDIGMAQAGSPRLT